jgi:hypothetical protein
MYTFEKEMHRNDEWIINFAIGAQRALFFAPKVHSNFKNGGHFSMSFWFSLSAWPHFFYSSGVPKMFGKENERNVEWFAIGHTCMEWIEIMIKICFSFCWIINVKSSIFSSFTPWALSASASPISVYSFIQQKQASLLKAFSLHNTNWHKVLIFKNFITKISYHQPF